MWEAALVVVTRSLFGIHDTLCRQGTKCVYTDRSSLNLLEVIKNQLVNFANATGKGRGPNGQICSLGLKRHDLSMGSETIETYRCRRGDVSKREEDRS